MAVACVGQYGRCVPQQEQRHQVLITALPTDVMLKVQDAVFHSPPEKPFHNLREALLHRYKKPDHVYFSQLQALTLGNETPSSLWDRMMNINTRCTTPLPDPLLCQFLL